MTSIPDFTSFVRSGLWLAACEHTVVAGCLEKWMRPILDPYGGVSRKEVGGQLGDVIRALSPFVANVPMKTVIVPMFSGWSAIFDNGYRGTDASGCRNLSRLINGRTIRVASMPNTIGRTSLPVEMRTYGAVVLEVCDSGEYSRIICAANDGGKWVFRSVGNPFPFEETEVFQRKKIQDRFTHEVLVNYLRKLAVDPFSRDSYVCSRENPSIMLLRNRPPKGGPYERDFAYHHGE